MQKDVSSTNFNKKNKHIKTNSIYYIHKAYIGFSKATTTTYNPILFLFTILRRVSRRRRCSHSIYPPNVFHPSAMVPHGGGFNTFRELVSWKQSDVVRGTYGGGKQGGIVSGYRGYCHGNGGLRVGNNHIWVCHLGWWTGEWIRGLGEWSDGGEDEYGWWGEFISKFDGLKKALDERCRSIMYCIGLFFNHNENLEQKLIGFSSFLYSGIFVLFLFHI